jgi:hypothetical protein
LIFSHNTATITTKKINCSDKSFLKAADEENCSVLRFGLKLAVSLSVSCGVTMRQHKISLGSVLFSSRNIKKPNFIFSFFLVPIMKPQTHKNIIINFISIMLTFLNASFSIGPSIAF